MPHVCWMLSQVYSTNLNKSLMKDLYDTLVYMYAPLSPLNTQVYFADVHPKFPKGGKMSQYLNSLSVGDTVDIRGPAGKVVYLGRGYFRVKDPGKPEEIRFATDVGLIAGGTGNWLWHFTLSYCHVVA